MIGLSVLSAAAHTLVLEPLLHRLRDRACIPSIHENRPSERAPAEVSVYTDAVSIFVSCRRDNEVVQKMLER